MNFLIIFFYNWIEKQRAESRNNKFTCCFLSQTNSPRRPSSVAAVFTFSTQLYPEHFTLSFATNNALFSYQRRHSFATKPSTLFYNQLFQRKKKYKAPRSKLSSSQDEALKLNETKKKSHRLLIFLRCCLSEKAEFFSKYWVASRWIKWAVFAQVNA